MKTMLLYSFAITKRHAFAHKLYRRAHRAYAWFVGIPDRVYITMNGTLVAGLIGLFSGPVIVFLCTAIIVAIITLMKP